MSRSIDGLRYEGENPDGIHFLGYVKESLGSEKKF